MPPVRCRVPMRRRDRGGSAVAPAAQRDRRVAAAAVRPDGMRMIRAFVCVGMGMRGRIGARLEIMSVRMRMRQADMPMIRLPLREMMVQRRPHQRRKQRRHRRKRGSRRKPPDDRFRSNHIPRIIAHPNPPQPIAPAPNAQPRNLASPPTPPPVCHKTRNALRCPRKRRPAISALPSSETRGSPRA